MYMYSYSNSKNLRSSALKYPIRPCTLFKAPQHFVVQSNPKKNGYKRILMYFKLCNMQTIGQFSVIVVYTYMINILISHSFVWVSVSMRFVRWPYRATSGMYLYQVKGRSIITMAGEKGDSKFLFLNPHKASLA